MTAARLAGEAAVRRASFQQVIEIGLPVDHASYGRYERRASGIGFMNIGPMGACGTMGPIGPTVAMKLGATRAHAPARMDLRRGFRRPRLQARSTATNTESPRPRWQIEYRSCRQT